MSTRAKNTGVLRWWQAMRPYEWRHTDPRFIEWLRTQGLSKDNWLPPAGPAMERPGRRR
jgi:hypothetical protein